MLNYKLRLKPDQVSQETLKWTERYASPDLSFVSGVTDTSYNLGTFKSLSVESKAGGGSDIVHVISKDVRRTGYVIVSGKTYEVKQDTAVNFVVGSSVTYNYVELNGKYYYSTGSPISFTIDNWLGLNPGKQLGEWTVKVSATTEDGKSLIRLDTLYWIEGDTVTIDGEDYYIDREEKDLGLRYYPGGEKLKSEQVTDCELVEITLFDPYKDVTEFMLMKVPDKEVRFDSVGFCDYFFFVLYKNTYCHVVPSGDTYACLIPNILLDSANTSGYSATTVYMHEEDMGGENKVVSGDIITLRDTFSFVQIKNETIQVDHTVLSSNGGSRLIVYLTNDAIVKNLNPGNRILFKDNEMDLFFEVHDPDTDGPVTDDKEFILFDGSKYYIEKNICDKAVMCDFEYDIEYPNGKEVDKDCLVVVEGERIKMKIIQDNNAYKVSPYPNVVLSSTSSTGNNVVSSTTYEIKSYDGVIIGGKKYLVHEETVDEGGTSTVYQRYVVYDHGNDYSMIVDEIIGSSAVVCYPDIHTPGFSDTFIKNWEGLVMTSVVYGADNMSLYVPNTIFGVREITPQLAVTNLMAVNTDNTLYVPKSSDEYYSITDDLLIYVNNRYINVPLILDFNSGGNPLQSDVVENEFYQAERDKVINKIVDMERDVYIPKVLKDGVYAGSESDFRDISEIQINLHFRTRDENWKVQEDAKMGWDLQSSAKTNWFITDYYPYKDILEDSNDGRKPLLDTASELMGLLYFENGDIYYQKSRVANTFIRLSFYDSIDPQSQSLLHTSTVFMDEHMLFKKYVDNSKKGVRQYLGVSDKEIDDYNAVVTNRIVVNGEPLDEDYKHDKPKEEPTPPTKKVLSAVTLDDEHRLSSRFTIKNKYATDTSSEGFYLYIFKEYSPNLKPKPIYMKVEFNHAGIGHTIPFMRPMIFSGGTNDEVWYPKSGITLSNTGDVKTLKEGIRLQDFYSQIYIPLYAVFDYKNREYAYVFDDRYVKVDDNGVAQLNLFEVKIKDESDKPEAEPTDIEKKRLYKIDRNQQFPEIP